MSIHGLKSLLTNEYMLYGIGGAPEGSIVSVAAKAIGGDYQAQRWITDDGKIGYLDDEVLGLDRLVPGNKADAVVSLTPITPDITLNIPEVRIEGDEIVTNTMVISNNSAHIVEHHYAY